MFMPLRNVPVNILNMTKVFPQGNLPAIAKLDTYTVAEKLVNQRKHGFNLVIGSTSLTEKELAGYVADGMYRGDWGFSIYPFAKVCEFVGDYPSLVNACTEAKLGYLYRNHLFGFTFYDQHGEQNLSIEEVIFDLSVNESVESFSSNYVLSRDATNQPAVAANIIGDIRSLIEHSRLPGMRAEFLNLSAEVTANQILVLLTFNGQQYSWRYDISRSDNLMRCTALSRYLNVIPGFSNSFPLSL